MRHPESPNPASTVANPDEASLGDLLDVPALQELMNEFYAVARIPMSLIDHQGNVLVGVGWQDICTHFHRVNEASCRHCHESDLELSAGLALGESRLYKCKNYLWDMATPVVVDGRHVGNVFSGQFFFDDETPDRELFRAQARRFGFDETAYLAALDRIPRLSRQAVDRGMGFFLKLAATLSRLGHTNVKLARLLADRDQLTRSLLESETRYRNLFMSLADEVGERRRAEKAASESREDLSRAQEVGQIGSWRLDVRSNVLSWSDQNYRIFGVAPGTPLTYESFLAAIHPDDRADVDAKWNAGLRGEPYDVEHRIVVEGRVKWVREKAYLEFGPGGSLLGGFGITQDISDRKEAEQALRESEEHLRASLNEKEVLLKEVHHRVKNNMQVISSIVRLQAEALPDSALRDAFDDIRDRVRSMSLVHEKLYQSESLAQVDLAEYSRSLLQQLWRAHAAGSNVRLTLSLQPLAFTVDQAVPFGLVLNELAQNALKHAFVGRDDGEVRVTLGRDQASESVRLEVQDDGRGLPPGFDWRRSTTLGLRLVRMLAQQLNGTLGGQPVPGGGTAFELVFRLGTG